MTAYDRLPPLAKAQGAAARGLPGLPRALKELLSRGLPDELDSQRLDPNVRAMLGGAELSGRDELGDRPVEQARRRFTAEIVAMEGPQPRVYNVENLAIPGPAGVIAARLYSPPPREEGLGLLVHFHGGGHVLGDLDSCEAACRLLVREAEVAVLSIDYRMAPEHRFPAALDDCFAAFAFATEQAGRFGVDPARIGVGGDSAGGNLAAAVSLAARDAGGPVPAFQLLLYPAVDLTRKRPSRQLFAERLLLTDEDIEWYREQYIPDVADLKNPLASPLLAENLAGLPAAYVATAGFDPLRDEGEEYAALLARAGVPAVVDRSPGLVHGFANYTAVVPAAREAMLRAAGALRLGLAPRGD